MDIRSACSAVGASTWQQLEFGSFQADLPVWLDLSSSVRGPVLELGSGAGRVAIPLAAQGRRVIAVEQDPDLCRSLLRSSSESHLPITVVEGRFGSDLSLEVAPALIIAPMHFTHLMPLEQLRTGLAHMLRRAGRAPRIGLAVLDDDGLVKGESEPTALPDMTEVDGRILSSRIIRTTVGQERIELERLREIVEADGSRAASPEMTVLWRRSLSVTVEMFEDLGYRLESSGPMPSEEGMAPSVLLVFDSARSDRR